MERDKERKEERRQKGGFQLEKRGKLSFPFECGQPRLKEKKKSHFSSSISQGEKRKYREKKNRER